MNRYDVRKIAACPKCGVAVGQKCQGKQGGKNHLERTFAAQDIEMARLGRVRKKPILEFSDDDFQVIEDWP